MKLLLPHSNRYHNWKGSYCAKLGKEMEDNISYVLLCWPPPSGLEKIRTEWRLGEALEGIGSFFDPITHPSTLRDNLGYTSHWLRKKGFSATNWTSHMAAPFCGHGEHSMTHWQMERARDWIF